MKADGEAETEVVARFDGGFSWIAYPDETMRRASHAIAVDGDVWLIDPVDGPGLDDAVEELGDVAGVAVLLDRHVRDSAALAERHDVAVHVPSSMDGVAARLDAPTERFDGALADTGFEAIRLVDNRFWQEVALHDPAAGTLVVPESVGASDYFLAGDERLGVHPMLRLRPPRRALDGLAPDRVLVGHGAPILEDAEDALRDALANGRRRTPRLLVDIVASRL